MFLTQATLLALLASPAAAEKSVDLAAGDYAVSITRNGVRVACRGETIAIGSSLTVFKPKYQGTLLSMSQCWPGAQVSVSKDGRSAVVEGKAAGGSLQYAVAISDRGVTATAKLTLAAGVEVGPVEYPAFKLPEGIVTGGTIEVSDVAGTPIETLAIPREAKRGGLTGSGDGLAIRTAAKQITVVSEPTRIYLFDARVERYGKDRGLWVFASLPVHAGRTTTATVTLAVRPTPKPAPAGTVRFASGASARTVATAPNPTAREKLAADELVDYLARISGKRLDRIEIADRRVPEGTIAVGRLAIDAGLISAAELKPLGRDGYVMRVEKGRAAVAGSRDLGTVYAAYALLGRLGVRFYAPGCEIVPSMADVRIPEFTQQTKPAYEFRYLEPRPAAVTLKLGQTPADDVGNPRELGEPGGIVHAADFLVPFDKYGTEHPEYFALQKNGRRLAHQPNEKRFDVHLCLANPEVRRISTERLLWLMDQQPERTFFGISQGDGYAWCECQQCKALDGVPGVEMTDRLSDYVNAIARQVTHKHPEKRILTLAYTNATSPPPKRVTPEPNVLVQYCPYPRRTNCQSHDLNCPQNQQGLADLQGWLARCPHNMAIFDYPRGYKIWLEPFGSFWAMKRKLDFYADHGIRGLFYCGVPTNFHDLFVFVQSRLLWEPKADVDRLADEFMGVYYGKAAGRVREYFDFMHQEVDRRQVHQMCEGANPGLVTAEYADKALALLADAERLVSGDRAALYRVRAEKICVLFADLNERNPGNRKLTSRDQFNRRLAEFARIGRTMRLTVVGRREAGVVADWLDRIARLRPETTPWYLDPLVTQVVEDSFGQDRREKNN